MIWKANYSGFSVTPRPVYGRGKVFLSTSFMRPTVLAVDPVLAAKGGAGDVTDAAVAWTLKRGGPNTPSPLLIGEELYLVSDNGVASCVDADGGEVVWTERLGGGLLRLPPPSPTAASTGSTRTASAPSPPPAASFAEARRQYALPGRTLASPAVSGGAIYIRTDAKLYKLTAPR